MVIFTVIVIFFVNFTIFFRFLTSKKILESLVLSVATTLLFIIRKNYIFVAIVITIIIVAIISINDVVIFIILYYYDYYYYYHFYSYYYCYYYYHYCCYYNYHLVVSECVFSVTSPLRNITSFLSGAIFSSMALIYSSIF